MKDLGILLKYHLWKHREYQHKVYKTTNKIKLPVLLAELQNISQCNLEIIVSKHQIQSNITNSFNLKEED